jgi:hypothetical protein
MTDWPERKRMFRIGCVIQAQHNLECAREFDAEAQDAAAAGFPDVAEEARTEAREARQAAATFRRLTRG